MVLRIEFGPQCSPRVVGSRLEDALATLPSLRFRTLVEDLRLLQAHTTNSTLRNWKLLLLLLVSLLEARGTI